MLHPSYTDLINAVNSEVEPGEQPVVQSRYSIVLATSKRARQIIGGDEPLIARAAGKKPLSIAVQELYEGKVKILGDNDAEEEEEAKAIEAAADGDPEAFGIEAVPDWYGVPCALRYGRWHAGSEHPDNGRPFLPYEWPQSVHR